MKLIVAGLLLGMALPISAQTTNQQWNYRYGMAKFYYSVDAKKILRGGESDPQFMKEVDWLAHNYPSDGPFSQPLAVLSLETCQTVLMTAQIQIIDRSLGGHPTDEAGVRTDIQSCIKTGHVAR